MNRYFEYTFEATCGLPSVTLEGTRNDWVNILSRIDKFEEFGKEPTTWAKMLRPIIGRFVDAFDGKRDLDFWNNICHYRKTSGCAGETSLSGWITAFCVWSCEGKWTAPSWYDWQSRALKLDGIPYLTVDYNNIPVGFCEVDVNLIDHGVHFDCMMVAGHVGSLSEGKGAVLDTLRPVVGWFMFTKPGKVPPGPPGIRKEAKDSSNVRPGQTSMSTESRSFLKLMRWMKKRLHSIFRTVWY